MSYEEAVQRAATARRAVEEMTILRNEARTKQEASRNAYDAAARARDEAKLTLDGLGTRLRQTREAIMGCEAASKRAHLDVRSAQDELAAARNERIAAEQRLQELERTRDKIEKLLDGARDDVQKIGANAQSSRLDLGQSVQRATNAQRALDAALVAYEEAQNATRAAQARLDGAKVALDGLPDDEKRHDEIIRKREQAVGEAKAHAEEAARVHGLERERLREAEKKARELKVSYDSAQTNLRTAIAAADRAEAVMREARLAPDLDEHDRERLVRATADYAAAGDVRSAAMTVNAQALTALADADVEAIRIRVRVDEAAVAVDDANAGIARAERELREAREMQAMAIENRERSLEEIGALETALGEAEENEHRHELIVQEAREENSAAQQGLRDVQERAVRYGKESRDAADAVDERRHELTAAVANIELERDGLSRLKSREEACAQQVQAAVAARDEADRALADAHDFIEAAEAARDARRVELRDSERRMEALSEAFHRADEELSRAQRDFDVAQADLTDAEVSVIMAEIDSH